MLRGHFRGTYLRVRVATSTFVADGKGKVSCKPKASKGKVKCGTLLLLLHGEGSRLQGYANSLINLSDF